MSLMLFHQVCQFLRARWFLLLLVGIATAGVAGCFPLSYLTGSNVLIGIFLFPLIIFANGVARFNILYFGVALLFAWLAFTYHHKIFFFFGLAFYFIFLFELFLGRVNTLIVFLVAAMSPVFLQISVIIGFPIRLYLSQWAGAILKFTGFDIVVEGNVVVLNNVVFTVDDACMGLTMLAISMLMGVLIIAHHYKVSQRKLSFFHLLIFFFTLFLLNIVSNLFRILILVIFKILPENPLHDVIGISCLILYVMVPLYFSGRWFVKRFGKLMEIKAPQQKFDITAKLALLGISFLFMLLGFIINPVARESTLPHANVNFKGLMMEEMDKGITKIYNDEVLIYVKPIPEFFTGEHTPLFCWKGSGYEFKKVKQEKIDDLEIYRGVLTKGKKSLHTAWWYTNGKITTIDQFTWRSKMLRGEEMFYLVNITARDETLFEKNLKQVLKQDFLAVHVSIEQD
jgi:exosortase N